MWARECGELYGWKSSGGGSCIGRSSGGGGGRIRDKDFDLCGKANYLEV